MPSRTLWLWLFVGSLGVTALLGMAALLLPGVPFEEKLIGTSALVSGYSLAGLMASVAIAGGRSPGLAWPAVVALGVSLLLWLVLVWAGDAMGYRAGENTAKSAATLTIVGVLALHASLLLHVRFRRPLSRTIRWITIGTAALAGLMLMTFLWGVWDSTHYLIRDWIGRLNWAMAIPAALGTIAVPVLARIEAVARRDSDDDTFGRFVPVHFRCPRCEHESEQAANRRFLCPGCGLEARISIAEPRCVCGYLLHGLPEPVCPECGRPIDEDLWWRTKNPAGPPRSGEAEPG